MQSRPNGSLRRCDNRAFWPMRPSTRSNGRCLRAAGSAGSSASVRTSLPTAPPDRDRSSANSTPSIPCRESLPTPSRPRKSVSTGISRRAPLCYYSQHDVQSSRFVLLIEDLEVAQRRFEQDTCSPNDAELALRQLGAFHAASWDGRGRNRPAFLKRLENSEHATLQGPGLPRLLAYRPTIDSESQVLTEREYRLVRNQLSRGPLTVVLDDLHVGNLFRGPSGGRPTITFMDFQFVCLARGPVDVARLLAGSLDPDARRAVEMRLLGTYHDALTSGGVMDYSHADCLRDYRLGLLWGRLRLVTNNLVMKAISVDASSDARTELARQIERFSTAVQDLDCRELLRD